MDGSMERVEIREALIGIIIVDIGFTHYAWHSMLQRDEGWSLGRITCVKSGGWTG